MMSVWKPVRTSRMHTFPKYNKYEWAFSSSDQSQHYCHTLCIVTYSNFCPPFCPPRPHNNHQLSAQLLLCFGHREEKLPRLHCSDESCHAGQAGVCAHANDGRWGKWKYMYITPKRPGRRVCLAFMYRQKKHNLKCFNFTNYLEILVADFPDDGHKRC